MLESKTKELCRVCARELCGNQRRWIFHPAAKLSLHVLLSHALGRELNRDGRGEFVCSKCAFMLDRMYRFDTVIARVEALSIERMHKLLLEKDRLRQCIGGLYRKNNADEFVGGPSGTAAAAADTSVDVSVVSEGRYGCLLEEDLTYSLYESWAEHDSQEHVPDQSQHQCHARSEVRKCSRKCKGCAALRVADSDYEAVCKVPRKVGRSTSCGPSARHSTTVLNSTEEALGPPGPKPESPSLTETGRAAHALEVEHASLSPATSEESLDVGVDAEQPCLVVPTDLMQDEMEEGRAVTQNPGVDQKPITGNRLELALSLIRSFQCHPIQVPAGSRLPVPIRRVATPGEGPCSLLRTLQPGPVCPYSTQPVDTGSVSTQQELQLDLAEMEELWLDDYVQCRPPCLQKKLIGEQQAQLGQYEAATGRCVSELQKTQQQVQTLQNKTRESQANNEALQQRLIEVECELRSVREVGHRRERTIQDLNARLHTKNSEVADLQRIMKDQEEHLRSLNQQHHVHRLQAIGEVPAQLKAELLELRASLFSAQVELQGAQRAQHHAQRREDDLARCNQRLLADLQDALRQEQDVEKHNQELLMALQRARSDLELMEERWREGVEEKEREMGEREKSIRELQTSLQHKERLLQDYSELLDRLKEPGGNRDVLIHKLKQRIQERDRALERALDEKFVCVEQKEAELRKLQLLLREKERDLEKLRRVLSNNEETIISLEMLLRGKALELDQVSEAWRNTQRSQRDSEDTYTHSLRERDTLIGQLKTALHTHTEQARVWTGAGEVVEELRSQLQLKERQLQDLLAVCSQNAKEHHTQVQDLLNTIRTRDQYIKDSAERTGHVMSEQTARVQELRRQLLSAAGTSLSAAEPSADVLSLQEELRMLLAREREVRSELSTLRSTLASNQDQIQAQAAEMEALTKTVSIKDEIIKDLQMQLVEPLGLPLVERLTQELQELRERTSHQDPSCPMHKDSLECPTPPEMEQAVKSHTASGDFTSDEEEEEDDCSSEFSDSMGEETSRLTAQSLAAVQGCEQRGGLGARPLSQNAVLAAEAQGLAEVKLLVEQKKAVERELCELRAQLDKAGFSTFSQMRRALLRLRCENEDLRCSATGGEEDGRIALGKEEEEEEEGLGEEERRQQEQREEDFSVVKAQGNEDRRRCTRPLMDLALLSHSTQVEEQTQCGSGVPPIIPVEAGLRDHTLRLTSDLQQVQQESRELQQRLLVSEATVQAQAEQLKGYREHFKASVQQDSKQVQVDLQDLGYETCGRSENEAERDDTSSPEFDDLDVCTSLSCGDGATRWWTKPRAPVGVEGDAAFLRRLVEDLRAQLSRSQTLVRTLQAGARDAPPATPPNATAPTPPTSTLRKVNWGVGASQGQDGAEEDEGWQSSDGGGGGGGFPPRHAHLDGGLQQLMERVTSLEEQVRRGKKHTDEGNSATWPGKFDTLIQGQARELSHLRQRLREGRGLCSILTQHLADTTKTFEELLRANDIDYYMGQSFREQLGQSTALARRLGDKISSRDHSELPDDKTGHDLLAVRLSKELQEKEKLIETLRSKLNQEHPRPDTPASSHAPSEATDQSERMSFVSDEQGSTNEDLEVCSDLDAASQFTQEETTEKNASDSCGNQSSAPSNPPTSQHDHQSSSSYPSMHYTPHRLMEGRVQTELSGGAVPSLCTNTASLTFDPQSQHLRPRCHGTGGFSLAEVQQELQMLQRQFRNSDSQVKPLPAFPVAPSAQLGPSCFHPVSQHAFHPSPLKPGTRLLENSALWDMTCRAQPMRGDVYGGVASGLSGYQSGPHHTESGWMEEHVMEIRSLRQRLEDSILTNDRLRQQLEERLVTPSRDGAGAPTNIYIQGLDSVPQLSSEVRALKDENRALHNQLQQVNRDGMKEAEQLREALQSGRVRLKQAELEAEQWVEQCRHLQQQVVEHTQAAIQLKQDRQASQENANRLQHEINIVQLQLSESQRLVHTLQGQLQGYQRVCGNATGVDTGAGLSLTFDLQETQTHMRLLEKQLNDRLDLSMPRPSSRRQLFHDESCSPPVRDSGLFGPSSPLPLEPDDQQPGSQESCVGGWEGGASDGPFSCRSGRHVVGRVDDLNALQHGFLEAKRLVQKMETALQIGGHTLQQGCGRSLMSSTVALKQILEETGSVLRMFWRAALPSTGSTSQHCHKDQRLKDEVVSLKRKVSEQDQALREALDSLRSSNRTKDSMEHFIASQLSRTRDVLKKARSNLEKNELKISSLGSSHPPLSSTSPWASRGEVPTIACPSSCGWSNVTSPSQHPNRGMSDPGPAQHRPLEAAPSSALQVLRATVAPLW
ncbi:myomegalin isoform X3 [Brachyhypopomus gauderio]|uniref:myomegalin isoform X3 n=1 Tax=Brachyhypopomus gauderio TaxID=698409 RepID=UPI004042A92C